MEELYRRANRYSTLEDNLRVATQTVMIISKSTGNSKPEGKKPPKPGERQNKKRKRLREEGAHAIHSSEYHLREAAASHS